MGTRRRTCLLHVPPANEAKQGSALVIAFHRSGGSGQRMARTTGFSAIADQHGFIVAYPDAIIGKGLWNTLFCKIPGGEGVQADDVDDVAYVLFGRQGGH